MPDDPSLRDGRRVVPLNSLGPDQNVNIRLENLTKVFLRDLSPRLVDLLELATYIYTADCGTRRGTAWTEDDTREPWDRDLRFVMPVRDLEFWTRQDVGDLLVRMLRLLSDDNYSFDFTQLARDRAKQLYLDLEEQEDWPFYDVERVLLFSGGLDSLAGAVETAESGGKLVLVSHRPVSTMSSRQRKLFKMLRDRYPNSVIHVPVWVNKDENFGREPSQRTRSFLFSALGTVVAHSLRAGGVRFFENGVVSLNLPVADEVLRARASRTTHPEALQMFSELYRLVTEREFVVDNPYIFKTKTEVVSSIGQRGAADLIPYTCSCAHTGHFHSKTQWHCGTCSQCIDRRIATEAAGLADHDPETDYVVNAFTGPRKEGYEQNMAVDYARHAIELHRMGEMQIASRFNRDLSRATRSSTKRRETAEALVAMHKRHGESVYGVLQEQLQHHSQAMLDCSLDGTSMLAMIAGQKHRESAWKRYADRIGNLLAAGLPKACRTRKPVDEPHLQEICDGILAAHDMDLVREFPFMRWSSSMTKPDWSVEAFSLWIELKYVRKKADIRPITAAVAEDITKYGDNKRRVLYVVYDPLHLVDQQQFAEPIIRRPEMMVRFVV